MNRRDAIKQATILMGGMLSAGAMTGLMSGCKADPSSDWIPQFFTPEEGNAIAEICERILPKTSTPGAKDLMVDRFIDAILHGFMDKAGQDFMRKGLAEFEADCQKTYKANFVKLEPAQQDEILLKWDKASPTNPPTIWGGPIGVEAKPSFYRSLKGLCLLGYFNSEKVGEEILNYDPVPGQQIGCVPLSEVGNAWSL